MPRQHAVEPHDIWRAVEYFIEIGFLGRRRTAGNYNLEASTGELGGKRAPSGNLQNPAHTKTLLRRILKYGKGPNIVAGIHGDDLLTDA